MANVDTNTGTQHTDPPPIPDPAGSAANSGYETIPAQGQTPAILRLTIDDIGPLSRLKGFDIRNGAVSAAHSLLVKATLPVAWHWQPIDNLPTGESIKYATIFVRQAYAYLNANAGLTIATAMRRKIAIILGVARAVCTELYTLSSADITPGEQATSYVTATAGPGNTWIFDLKHGLSEAVKESFAVPFAYTDEEKAVIASIHMSAVGLLPVQGYSLIMTGHHYLSSSDNQSRRAFLPIERQHWTGSVVSSWWVDGADELKDAMWHKVGHPVLINIKKTLAMKPEVKAMLIAAGAGSAAARLPAEETEMRRAQSYSTLVGTVRPLLETYKGRLDYSILTEAMAAVKAFPVTTPAAGPVVAPTLEKSIPASVVDRESALAHLAAVLDRNSEIVAYAFGFYTAMSEQHQMTGAGGSANSLLSSYSLKGLKNGSYSSYMQGYAGHGDYAAARNRLRMEGKFGAPNFKFR